MLSAKTKKSRWLEFELKYSNQKLIFTIKASFDTMLNNDGSEFENLDGQKICQQYIYKTNEIQYSILSSCINTN